MNDRIIIGLYSPSPGHGKTTIANNLWVYGYRKHSFAQAFRNMLMSLLVDMGIPHDKAWDSLTVNKENVIPQLGVTGRHLMRTLGTEWGRDCVHPNLWVTTLEAKIRNSKKVVIDDVRFPNEAFMIRKNGGQVWLVTSERAGFTPEESSHRSDGELDGQRFDRHITNDLGFAKLHLQIQKAVEELEANNQVVY